MEYRLEETVAEILVTALWNFYRAFGLQTCSGECSKTCGSGEEREFNMHGVNEKSSLTHNRPSTFVTTNQIYQKITRAAPLFDEKRARSASLSPKLSNGGTSHKRQKRVLTKQPSIRRKNGPPCTAKSVRRSELHFCAQHPSRASADLVLLETTLSVAPSTTTQGGAIIFCHSFYFLPVNDQQKAWEIRIFS
jgi:hypothetical protein